MPGGLIPETPITSPEARSEELGLRNRTVELDFARGLSILLVMGYHFKTVPTHFFLWRSIEYPLKSFGPTGVDMFFVLSGFLVGGLLLQEYKKRGEIRLGRFLVRRAFKIFPAYYAYLLFQVIVRHFPLRTFFWQNLLQVQNYTWSSISHSWTVSLEVHFYLLLALSMSFLASRQTPPRTLLKVFAVAGLASFVSRIVTIHFGHWKAGLFFTHNRLDSLLCGVILATLACFYPKRFTALTNRRWPFAIVALFLVYYLFLVYPATMVEPAPGWGYFGSTILYLGYAAMLLFLMRYTHHLSTHALYKAVAWVGTYSYGIYLWQNSVRQPWASFVAHLPPAVQWPSLFLGQYVSAILLGVLMTRLVEWPFLRFRERLIPQQDVRTIDQLAQPVIDADSQATPTKSPLEGRLA